MFGRCSQGCPHRGSTTSSWNEWAYSRIYSPPSAQAQDLSAYLLEAAPSGPNILRSRFISCPISLYSILISLSSIRRFFSHCTKEQWLLFRLLLETGARPAEIVPSLRPSHVALLKEEVKPETRTVIIRNAKLKPGQEEKIRELRISEELMEELAAYARTIPGPHVFAQRNNSLKNSTAS